MVEETSDNRALSVTEASEKFGIPASTIRSWLKQGKLTRYRRQWRKRWSFVDPEEVAAMNAIHVEEPPPKE